jgi:hypothetical protein
MGNPVTSSQFVRLLDERLSNVAEDTTKDLKSMIPMFFDMKTSNSAWEEFFDVGNVPDIPEMNGKKSRLSISPGYHIKIEHKEYGAYLEFERKLLDDKKYSVLDGRAAKMVKAAHRSKEKQGVKLFANSTSIAFDFQTHEENVALVSSSHTTKSGASTATGFDNSGTSAASKTAVAATRILMNGFRDDIGERIEMSDNLAIVCPYNLADTFEEIVGTPKGYDTADHTMNNEYQRYKVIPYKRLDDYDTNNWYMVDLDNMKENACWYDRVMPEIQTERDFLTEGIRTSIYYRCSYGHRDWRWIYGHTVS